MSLHVCIYICVGYLYTQYEHRATILDLLVLEQLRPNLFDSFCKENTFLWLRCEKWTQLGSYLVTESKRHPFPPPHNNTVPPFFYTPSSDPVFLANWCGIISLEEVSSILIHQETFLKYNFACFILGLFSFFNVRTQ